MTSPVELINQAIAKADSASEIMRRFANYPVGAFIETESGPLPSLAQWLSEQQGQIDLSGIENRLTTVELALASVDGQLTELGEAITKAGVVVDTVAEARALSGADYPKVFALGYYKPGDGGGGHYPVSDTETGGDNGGSILVTPDGKRRVLAKIGKFTLREFGCKGDGIADDTPGYLAIVATGQPFHVDRGRFKVAPIGATVSYPGGREPNRTSAATLASGQNVTGEGDASQLIWGGTGTPQAFFRVINGKNITVSGVKFIGGYSAIIVDPIADGAVDNVGLKDCILDGQLIGYLGGRQYALDPTGSKSCSNLWMTGCDLRNIVVHGMVATNCYRPRACGNNFEAILGGFCVDLSQGCRGGAVLNNTGDNVKYFAKVESSNVDLNGQPLLPNPELVAGVQNTIMGNNITRIQEIGILLNSHTDKALIFGNELSGSITVAIAIGSVTGFAHDGQLIISNNIIDMESTNAVGIRSQLNTGTQLPQVYNNTITGGSIGIDWQTSRARLIGNNITTNDNGIRLGGGIGPAIVRMDIFDNDITSTVGISGAGTGAWKGMNFRDNTINCVTFSIYLATIASLTRSKFEGNTVNNGTVHGSGSIVVKNPIAVRFDDNTLNLAIGSAASIATTGATVKSMIRGTMATVGLSIASPDAATTANTVNNILDMAYAA